MDTTIIEQKLQALTAKRTERLKLKARADLLEQEEKDIQAELTAASVAGGQYGSYLLNAKTKTVPKCDDWRAFHTYILSSGNIEMLHKRLTETAVMEHIDAGESLPGISLDDKITYTVKEL